MASTARARTRFPVGKILTSTAAVLPAAGAFVADWNETHVYNPKWTPHAKFHNAQTICMSVSLAAMSLWASWRPGPDRRSSLRWATICGALFWYTLVPSFFFPGSTVVDADNPHQPFTKFGVQINQITVLAAIELPLLVAGYALESRRITGEQSR